jgi:hypothetical protein
MTLNLRTLGTAINRAWRNDLNSNFEDIENEVNDLDVRIDNIVANAGSSNTEIVDARHDAVNNVTHATLKDRLDDSANKFNKKTNGILNIKEFGAVGDGVTSDQTAIVSAVAYAKANGMALYWGSGTYVSTDNIPDFHTVKHFGDGVIKRGEDLFYISPRGTQRNKLYVSTTLSSNTFDGLSLSHPVARLSVACDYLTNYGPVLRGYWEIVMSAGTHSYRAEIKPGLLSENPIEITGADVGGHPNVPTTIISEGIGVAAMGLKISGGTKIKVKNIKFVGFNGSSSSAGINASNGSEVTTDNVHCDQCFYGISGQNSNIVIPNGIFENCGRDNLGNGTGAAIRSLQLNRHSIGIQNAGSRANTAIFRNNRYGVWAQESSTGHVDWCTFEDNEYGFVGRVNARGNLDGCSFKRNQIAVKLDGNSHVYVSSNVELGTGADANTYNIVCASGSQVTSSNIIDGVDTSKAITDNTFELTYKNQTINTTSNTVFHTVTLKAPLWKNSPSSVALGKKIYFRIFGNLSGTNANKRIYVRLGSALLGVTFGATDTGSFDAYGYIYFTGSSQQYLFMSANRHLGTSVKQSRAIGSEPMTTNTNLTFEAQVDNTADSVLIDMIEIGWAG